MVNTPFITVGLKSRFQIHISLPESRDLPLVKILHNLVGIQLHGNNGDSNNIICYEVLHDVARFPFWSPKRFLDYGRHMKIRLISCFSGYCYLSPYCSGGCTEWVSLLSCPWTRPRCSGRLQGCSSGNACSWWWWPGPVSVISHQQDGTRLFSTWKGEIKKVCSFIQ